MFTTDYPVKNISREQYLDIDLNNEEKHEYFDGSVVVMHGAKTSHLAIVTNIVVEIGQFIKETEHTVFLSRFRVTTPKSNGYMYPDVLIVSGDVILEEDVFDTCTNPSVIIEVMSESTRNTDLGYKFFYYQQIPSLKEYILIDSTAYYAVVIRRQADDSWKLFNITDINGSIDIQTIGLHVSLTDIYAKVSFV